MGYIYLFTRQSPDSETIEGFSPPVILLITLIYFFTVRNKEQLYTKHARSHSAPVLSLNTTIQQLFLEIKDV